MKTDRQAAPTDEEFGRTAPQVRRVLWITFFLNLAVAAGKLVFGYASDIVSLQADGFHSIFDGMANVIGLVAMGLAMKPPDPEHPYGHRKIEVAASLIIGLMVTLGFLEVGRGVWDAATSDVAPRVTPASYAVVLVALSVSLGVSWYERRAGERLNSMILKADSAHTFTDSIAGVSVLIGMYLVDIGIAVGDVLAALAVMFFIGMTAYRVLREGIDVLVDTSYLDPQVVQQLVEDIDEVKSCHYVRSRGMPGHVHVDLHLTLDPDMRLERAGEILLKVKDRLKGHFADVSDVLVQIEPHKPTYVEDVPEKLV